VIVLNRIAFREKCFIVFVKEMSSHHNLFWKRSKTAVIIITVTIYIAIINMNRRKLMLSILIKQAGIINKNNNFPIISLRNSDLEVILSLDTGLICKPTKSLPKVYPLIN
jgi:hypothetical protein